MKLDFFNLLSKKLKYQISRKNNQWDPSCSMRTDRRTDMMTPLVAFRSFAKAPKNALHEDLRVFQNLAALGCHK
jgi:hypothetical protein